MKSNGSHEFVLRAEHKMLESFKRAGAIKQFSSGLIPGFLLMGLIMGQPGIKLGCFLLLAPIVLGVSWVLYICNRYPIPPGFLKGRDPRRGYGNEGDEDPPQGPPRYAPIGKDFEERKARFLATYYGIPAAEDDIPEVELVEDDDEPPQ